MTRDPGFSGVSPTVAPGEVSVPGLGPGRTFASAVITLGAEHEGWIRASNGFLVYSAILARVAEEHPALAERLHSPKARKPFTVSELCVESRHHSGRLRIDRGQTASFRITSLDSELTGVLDTWAARASETVQIGARGEGVEFRVLGVGMSSDRDRLAGRTTVRALVDQGSARPLPEPARLRVHFRTPTTFRSRGVDAPFPLPRFVFGGLARLWKDMGAREPVPSPNGLLQARFLEETFGRLFPPRKSASEAPQRALGRLDRMLRVHRFELQTRPMDFRPRAGLERGFVGRVEYDLVDPKDEALHRTLELLLDFGFFSGVGRKRAWGMGQVVRGDRVPLGAGKCG